MKAVRGHQGSPAIVELDEPVGFESGEVLDMAVAGICASDLNYLRLGTERILGHELAGRRADGTPVLIEGQFGCGDCDFCREGRNNLCHQSTKMALGIMRDGGMVEQFKVPAHKALEIPPGLNVSDACLAEAGSSRLARRPSRRDIVPARRLPSSVADRSDSLPPPPRKHRAPTTSSWTPAMHINTRSASGSEFANLRPTIDTTSSSKPPGSVSALHRSVEIVKPGGTIALLGVHSDGLDVPYSSLLTKEITLIASMGYCGHAGRREMLLAAEMLASRPEIPDSLITHRFPLVDAPEAFRVAGDRESGAIKVVVELE